MTSDEQTYTPCPGCGQEARTACCELTRRAFWRRKAEEELTEEELAAFRAANRNKAARARARQREADPEGYAAKKREEVARWREENPDRSRTLNASHNREYRRRKRQEPTG